MTPASVAISRNRLSQILAKEPVPETVELEVVRKNGSIVPVEVRGRFLRDERGKRTAFMGIYRDMTERKRAEAALRAAKEYAETLIKSSIDMIIAVNTERRITEFNPAAEKAFGYQRAEVIDQPVDMLYGDSGLGPNINLQVKTTGGYIGEIKNKRKNGELFDVHLKASPVYDAAGRVVGVMGISRDITDRKHAEDALRESEERYRILNQLISDCAFSFRVAPDGTFVLDWLTDSFFRMTGYDPQEFFDKPNPWERLMSAEAATQLAQVLQSLGPESAGVYDFPIIRKDGQVRWLRGYFHAVRDPRGALTWVYGATQDVTERKQAEDALRQSEERHRIVSQCMSDYAFSLRIEEGKALCLEWLTDSFTRVTGYPVSDFLGKFNPWTHYIHSEDFERVSATIRQMPPGTPTTYEFRIIRSDGAIRWIRSSAYVVRSEKGTITRLYGAAQDITERKHAEDVLQYQRAFEQLVASISKDFLNLTPEEINTGISRALRMVGEFSGIDRSYLFLFRENLAVMDNTHEWCAPGIASVQSQLQNMETKTFPWFVKKLTDFEPIYIPDVGALPPEAQAEKIEFLSQEMQSLISIPLISGKTVIGLVAFAAVRTTNRWTEESLLLLKVVGEMIASALERKWAAERQQQLQAQLLQTQKLEAIGTLAGGIAHDFNNILAAIMGYTELATDDVPSESRTRSNLEEVLTASRRARRLVQQLLTFSRPSHQDRRPVQLHDIVESTLTLLRASFPKHIDIHFPSPPLIATILADPIQIEQVVMNLCVNAAYAIGEHHGVLGIGIEYLEGERTTVPASPRMATPATYCLTVSDSGSGIDAEMLPHIFEPFFTTKPIGQGSGMGLAIVHGIVTSHGGSITVESRPGQGTTFRIYFPPWREPTEAQEATLGYANQELGVYKKDAAGTPFQSTSCCGVLEKGGQCDTDSGH
ncbi:MAG: PAS domain S-box protein [Deltaproteobacteria bacterium]|nr:PAS domain S-box protein [Deltaproteobacteria bacterium]